MQKSFEEISVSTTTVIVKTNLSLNLQWLYSISSTIQGDVFFKTSKGLQEHLSRLEISIGSIISVQYQDNCKGFKVKRRRTKYFRNALSIVLYVGKLVTIKIPTRGKIQITGCTSEEHTIQCIRSLWELVSAYPSSTETYLLDSECFISIIDTVMTNKVFDLGFQINRQNLDMYMNVNTEFNSLLETSFGYTGVNIKIPFQIDPKDEIYKKVIFNTTTKKWSESYMTYEEYEKLLSVRHRNKKYKNTFLVFHSGTAIMSGMSLPYMKSVFEQFVQTIQKARPIIEEKILAE